jgi:hypothetical protein
VLYGIFAVSAALARRLQRGDPDVAGRCMSSVSTSLSTVRGWRKAEL